MAPDGVSSVGSAHLAGSSKDSVEFSSEVEVADLGWFSLSASPGTVFRGREERVPSEFVETSRVEVKRRSGSVLLGARLDDGRAEAWESRLLGRMCLDEAMSG